VAWSNRSKATAALGAAGITALIYAIAVEPYRIAHVEIELDCARLPIEFDGYRILQISDLHMRRLGRREELLRTMIGRLPAHDLTLVTGDLIHTPEGAPYFLELAKSFSARDGIFAIYGNSEHKNGVRTRILTEQLTTAGVRALNNEHVTIARGGAMIYLMGVDDPVNQKDDIRAAIKGIPDDAFKLLMMHSPDPIAQAVTYGIDVVLSGHTHGGQIVLPFIGPLFTNSILGLSMSSGLFSGASLFRFIGFRAGRTQLYVTRGIGVSNFAMRFNCPPELTTITLRRR
jgi:predicted MPP superfamily phosphohydrolase